jgi:heme-degrading monooxygenase HmoA
MIGRVWHGSTRAANASAEHLQRETLPLLAEIEGHRGAYVLRRDADDEAQFIVLTLWESLDAVRAFAGADYEIAVIPPEARALLVRFAQTAIHYEVAIASI